MNHSIRIVGPVLCAVLLSACGSGGGGGAGMAAQEDAIRAISDKYDPGLDETSARSMPKTGTATYKGAAIYSTTHDIVNDMESDDEIWEVIQATSDVALTADFAAGSISGSLSNFHDEDGAVAGAVDITNGTITKNTIQGDLSGSLALSGKSSVATGDIEGVFNGDKAQVIGGSVTGSAGGTPLWGLLVADKQ